MYLTTLLTLVGFAAAFTVAAYMRKNRTLLLPSGVSLILAAVLIVNTGTLVFQTGSFTKTNVTEYTVRTGQNTVKNVSASEVKENVYTNIDKGYNGMPLEPSTALAILLMATGMYLSLAAVLKPEFMW
ncbi:MAG: hypothetical protein SVS85_04270 [Candidatus Nanohaloarchaea archaeon]|nr:hypothetical protein [Candidatus Nanohaloarchaea archaeon]